MKVDLDKLETSLEGLKNLRVEHSKQCPGVLTVTDITTGEQLDCIEPLLIRRSTEEDEAFTEAVAAACTNIFALIAELRELRADAAQASDAIISRIKEERRFQDRRWGGSTYDDKHSLGDWAHLIDQRTETLYRAPEHKVAKQELIEVAALAIAALESLWRNREGK